MVRHGRGHRLESGWPLIAAQEFDSLRFRMNQKAPEDFGFSVLEITPDSYENLKSLIEKGHKVTIQSVMNNGFLQAIVTPAI